MPAQVYTPSTSGKANDDFKPLENASSHSCKMSLSILSTGKVVSRKEDYARVNKKIFCARHSAMGAVV